jgi:putative restriction endonuclease
MKGFVGVTDNDWYTFLSQQQQIDEVNFWQPSGRGRFQALAAGEPFLFKLHAPHHFIVGGGFFAHSTILPTSLAWQAFGEKNGANSLPEMRRRTEKYRRTKPSPVEDYKIGCILLTQPFFFKQQDWIPAPHDFSLNIVRGKTYDLSVGHGHSKKAVFEEERKIADPEQRYGEPLLVLPRLGQGSFRVIVTDAYGRSCAITSEKTLPALEAAHIKPYKEGGVHRVENGILLRSDVHRLFDSGYVTVSTGHDFEVSKRIHEEFDNGKYYLTLHGKKIHVPSNPRFRPSPEFLIWHNENVFRG